MKANHTDITIVLDRSGSMQSVVDDTIGGFNRFLKDQQDTPGTATLTLYQFDDQFDVVRAAENIQTVQPLDHRSFVPRGYTALFDAIGKAVALTSERLEKTHEFESPSKIVFVIITDGQENSSREYSQEKVNELITSRRAKAWEFVFLAADQDAFQAAKVVGIATSNAMAYANNPIGTDKVWAAASSNLSSYRSAVGQSMAFSNDQRKEQLKAGVKKT